MSSRRQILVAMAAPLLHPLVAVGATRRRRAPVLPPVPQGYVVVGRRKGVPPPVLFAVALQESIMRFGDLALPYPWTLNVRRVPKRFPTYEQAVAHLQRCLQLGVTEVDCGLMQIHWKYHNHRLGNAARALDPYPNMEVGAALLREHYDKTKDWFAAVGRYHNANLEIGTPYARSVFKHLARIPATSAGAHRG